MKLGFGDKRPVGKCVFKGCVSSMKHHLTE